MSNIQHSDPDHLNPQQAADFAATFGVPRAEFEEAMLSDKPPPYVEFTDPSRPMFKVFHREDIRKWASERGVSQ